jgi:hypothetical protein
MASWANGRTFQLVGFQASFRDSIDSAVESQRGKKVGICQNKRKEKGDRKGE